MTASRPGCLDSSYQTFFFCFYISHGVRDRRVNPHATLPPASWRAAGPPRSDLSEGELVHAHQLLHADLEGVLIGVVPDDVVVHVNQDAVDDTSSPGLSYDRAAESRLRSNLLTR